MHFENLINLFFVSFIFNQDMPTFTNIKSNFIIFTFCFLWKSYIWLGEKILGKPKLSPSQKLTLDTLLTSEVYLPKNKKWANFDQA